MRIRSTLTLVAGLMVVLATLPALAQKQGDAPRENVKLTRDVEYTKVGDISLKLDVLEPKDRAAKTLPAIVFIHGGGWRNGNKSSGTHRLTPLVASGEYVGFSIQYRLTDVAGFPAQIHDCKTAIRWIKSQAEKYGSDPDRVGVWGSSAGGHLVSLLGTSADVAELEGETGPTDVSSRVKCVVDFCGPSDFLSFPDSNVSKQAVEPLLGGPVRERQEMAKQASPATYVTADDAPFLILHGTKDTVVPVQQAKTFHQRLKKAGVSSTLVLIEGGGHGFGGPEVNARVKDFFAQQLQGKEVKVSSEPIQAGK